MFVWTIVASVVLTIAAFLAGQSRAAGMRMSGGVALHSLPSYHGMFLAAGAISGAIVAAIAAALVIGAQSIVMPVAAVVGAAIVAGVLYPRINGEFRARNSFERFILLRLDCLFRRCRSHDQSASSSPCCSRPSSFSREVSPLSFIVRHCNGRRPPTPASFGFIPLLVGTLLITTHRHHCRRSAWPCSRPSTWPNTPDRNCAVLCQAACLKCSPACRPWCWASSPHSPWRRSSATLGRIAFGLDRRLRIGAGGGPRHGHDDRAADFLACRTTSSTPCLSRCVTALTRWAPRSRKPSSASCCLRHFRASSRLSFWQSRAPCG
jgi:hypothetical protein